MSIPCRPYAQFYTDLLLSENSAVADAVCANLTPCDAFSANV